MINLLLDIVAASSLLAAVRGGWVRWVKPYETMLDARQKGLMALAILTIAGGAIGSPFWWLAMPAGFSWQLPPLASRMLGAAGLAFATTGLYVMHRRRASLIRAYIELLAVYLAPLVCAILLFHLDRFDWRAPITYGFFIVSGGMAASAVWHLARRTDLPPFADERRPTSPAVFTRLYLLLVAVIFGVWGLTLFLFPNGILNGFANGLAAQIWVWPQDALTTRLIAVMLLTISTAGILSLRNGAAVTMSCWMFAVYGSGVTVACVVNAIMGKPVPSTYAAAFALLALTSLPLLIISSHHANGALL
jgi:hypothetical protein